MSASRHQNAPQEEAESPRKIFSGCGCLTIAILGVGFFFIVMTSWFVPIELFMDLLFGWISFLARTFPKITWNWDIAGLALFCVAAILFLSHRLLVWLVSRIAVASGKSWRWRWRWTWCSLSAVFIFFFVGMAIGGVAHQVGWLMTSKEPWYEEKGGQFRAHAEMRDLEIACTIAIEETNNDIGTIRKVYIQEGGSFYPLRMTEMLEKYHILFFVPSTRQVSGLLVFPRDDAVRKKAGGLFYLNNAYDFISSEKIDEVIQTNRQNLVPF